MMILALRLRNAATGEPYGVEAEECATLAIANDRAMEWWQSGGTAAVLVTVDGKEDARYERRWIDRARIPDGWLRRKKGAIAKLEAHQPLIPVDPAPEIPGPTLGVPEAKPEAELLAPKGCPCCGTPRANGGHPGDDDPSPSGRLNLYRCMLCGAASKPGTAQAALYARYMAFHTAVSVQHGKKPSPWRGPKGSA